MITAAETVTAAGSLLVTVGQKDRLMSVSNRAPFYIYGTLKRQKNPIL